MKKCLRIEVRARIPKDLLSEFIKKNALKLHIEGNVQIIGTDTMRIIVCGKKDAVDNFLDVLHDGYENWFPQDITVEPFLQFKDYRGVFRIIET